MEGFNTPGEALAGLDRVVDRYRGRRSYQAEFAREVNNLAKRAIESARVQVEVERAQTEGFKSGLTTAEQRRLERAEARGAELLAENSDLRAKVARLNARVPIAEHAENEGGTMVTFNNPKGPHGAALPWTVGELEAMCYHLRVAGATDTVPVEIERYVTKSVVEWPDLLDLRRPAEPPAKREIDPDQPGLVGRLRLLGAPAVSIVFLIAALVLLFLSDWP